MKLRKITKFLAVSTAIALVASFTVYAVPFKDHVIGTGTTVIECEDYDGGAENYWDANPTEGDHTYRTDEDPATGSGSRIADGYNIGWTSAGEWVQYTVNVEKSGSYKVSLWAGSGAKDDCPAVISVNGAEIGTALIPNIGWESFELREAGTVDLAAGVNVIRIDMPEGGLNLDALEIECLSVSEDAAAAPKASPKTGVESTMFPLIALVLSGTALVVIRKRQAEVR